jgi:tRNA U54 and U55 pseudouridine synthase Pus10
LNDEPVMRITVTRAEYDGKLSTVQETIASFAAITFAKLGLHKTDDKGALKEQEQQKTKTYKAALSFLPKDRVFVSPKLKT